MPLYRVQLKQGKRTLVEHIEAKSLTSLLAFYEYITTMKVSEVLRVEYLSPTDIIPIDDFVYNSLFKTFANSSLSSKSKQFIFHNIKKTVNENELAAKIIECLEVDNEPIGSIFATLMKE